MFNRILRAPQSGDDGLGSLRGPNFATRRYHGVMRGEEQSEVWFEAVSTGNVPATSERHPLPLKLDLRQHGPTGFAWGHGGSGPAQLALALLVDAPGDTELALAHYQELKRQHVSTWGQQWSITARTHRGALNFLPAASWRRPRRWMLFLLMRFWPR